MELKKENLKYTLEICKEISNKMVGCNEKQFKRIHHHYHHITLYIKDYIMKENCKNYLEIGSYTGHSLSTILQSKYKSNFMGIDIFKSWGDGNKMNLEKITNDNIKKFNKHNYQVNMYKGNSTHLNTLNKVKEYFPDGIDLLFIDGDHSYKGILNDFELYFPLVNKNGYIVFDDYLPYKAGNKIDGNDREAPKAINEIIKKYNNQIKKIGLTDDVLEIYKIKNNTPIYDNGNIPKNIDYIIQKI